MERGDIRAGGAREADMWGRGKQRLPGLAKEGLGDTHRGMWRRPGEGQGREGPGYEAARSNGKGEREGAVIHRGRRLSTGPGGAIHRGRGASLEAGALASVVNER